jgi:hypothetical protein
LIYLHTDVRCPEKLDPSKTPKASPFLDVGAELSRGIRITNVTEVRPKRSEARVSKVVCTEDADENIGRVFFVELEVRIICRDRVVLIPVPLLYFIAENLYFLVNFLLRYQLRLDTLVHIRDGGGSLGGSMIPMNFIHQARSALRFTRVICDASPEKKVFDTRRDFEALTEEIRHSEWYGNRRIPRLLCECLRETPEDEIRSTWDGRRIDYRQMPSNEFKSPDGNFYDWLPRAARTPGSIPQ